MQQEPLFSPLLHRHAQSVKKAFLPGHFRGTKRMFENAKGLNNKNRKCPETRPTATNEAALILRI